MEKGPETRSSLRRRLIAARADLPAAEHAEKSARLQANLQPLLRHLAPSMIGFCWAYRGEFDCRPLVAGLVAEGARAALPVIAAIDAPMFFRAWSPSSAMIEGHYGIPVPVQGATIVPDLILMPLNAFDRLGYRLGYGGGFFDRTLAALQPRPTAVGVGFELARVDSIDPGPFDLPMDYIVTEDNAFVRKGTGLVPFDHPRNSS
ncbi:MAG: 5-formyltetrahydrofolate cyclo-ligase [Rhodocyclaceae bacterium]